MLRLLLLRHAEAERARPGQGDHDRVLSRRGHDDAAAVGAVLAEGSWGPDLVLCSTSERTRQTWDAVRPALAGEPEARFLRGIYEAGEDYLPILRAEAGAAISVLLIGHNPAIQATAIQLASGLKCPDGAALSGHMPTASLAVLESDGGWAEIQPGSMQLQAFIPPGTGGRR